MRCVSLIFQTKMMWAHESCEIVLSWDIYLYNQKKLAHAWYLCLWCSLAQSSAWPWRYTILSFLYSSSYCVSSFSHIKYPKIALTISCDDKALSHTFRQPATRYVSHLLSSLVKCCPVVIRCHSGQRKRLQCLKMFHFILMAHISHKQEIGSGTHEPDARKQSW